MTEMGGFIRQLPENLTIVIVCDTRDRQFESDKNSLLAMCYKEKSNVKEKITLALKDYEKINQLDQTVSKTIR